MIDEIENAIPDFILNDYQTGKESGLTYALELVEELAEPKKPVVPQFVADWYEDNKDGFEYNVYDLCVKYSKYEVEGEIRNWFDSADNKPIQTLVNMHQFGYEVEKERHYRMKHKLTGEYVCFGLTKTFHSDDLNWYTALKKTHKDWEDLGYWNNNLYEPEEVLDD